MKAVYKRIIIATLALVALVVSLIVAWRIRKETVEAEARHHNNLGAALLIESLPDEGYKLGSEAMTEFEAALRLVPGYRPARINLGLAGYYSCLGLYLQEDAVQRSRSVMDSILEEEPRNPYAHYVLGWLDRYKHSDSAAAEHFRSVVVEDSGDSRSLQALAWSLADEKRFEEVVPILRKILDLEPTQPGALRALGEALAATGREMEAKAARDAFAELEKKAIGTYFPTKYTQLYWLPCEKYAMPVADSRDPKEQPDPRAYYRDVTQEIGIMFQHAGTSTRVDVERVLRGDLTPREWFQPEENRRAIAAAIGVGCAFADFNGDSRLDIFLPNIDGRHALYEGREKDHGSGGVQRRFDDVLSQNGLKLLPELSTACVAGDIDNDGLTELLLVGYGEAGLYQSVGQTLADITDVSGVKKGMPKASWCTTAAFSDVDHDGDLDIFVGCFLDLGRPAEGKDELRFPDDFPGQSSLLLRNDGKNVFADVDREIGLANGKGTRSALFTDLNDDLAVDLVTFDIAGRPAALLNQKDGAFASRPDVANTSPVIAEASAKLPPLGESRAFGDFNGDGAVDKLVCQNGQSAILYRNENAPSHWLTVRLSGCGKKCARGSNRAGVGARVEVRTPAMWRRKELRAGNGQGGCDAAELTFDLAGSQEVDFVRVLFPSGALGCVHGLTSNQSLTVKEPDLEKW